MHGYVGRILRVDLDAGRTWDEALDETVARDFIGGSGLAARLIYDLTDAETDPLGPDNPLALMTGPLVGTAMPSAGRCSVCALSPLTGLWGESNTGGFLGAELRFAGYDGVVVTGRAERPTWLSVVDGRAELRSAADLWGLDAYATQDRVRAALGADRSGRAPQARVACIGVAGERRVKMAAVMNDHGRAAGRTGMGAVMGAKQLKAIAVRGRAAVRVADGPALDAIAAEIVSGIQEDVAALALQLAGTAGYVDMALMYGDMPIRYYQQGEWAPASQLSGVLMSERYQKRRRACYRCPIACGRETRAPRYGLERADGPEFETLGALGTLPLIDDLEAVIYAGHLCNLYGLDTISAGCTIALACELFERGALTARDTGGIEVRYGDAATVHRLLGMMARREGFGDLLAEGSVALAHAAGLPELAVTVNGLDVPMHDPRAFAGMAVSYALSPRGACHMQGDMYGVDTGQGPALELGILPGDRFEASAAKGRIAARQQAWRSAYNALILCQFQNPGVERLVRALDAVTGWDVDGAALLQTGKRIVTLKRLFNIRRGLSREHDRLPKVLLQPLAEGGTEGRVPDLEALLSGAYREYGWDPHTGHPLPETLEVLGLEGPQHGCQQKTADDRRMPSGERQRTNDEW
jgi:aldehyde:ferredoxin oxidoreductase